MTTNTQTQTDDRRAAFIALHEKLKTLAIKQAQLDKLKAEVDTLKEEIQVEAVEAGGGVPLHPCITTYHTLAYDKDLVEAASLIHEPTLCTMALNKPMFNKLYKAGLLGDWADRLNVIEPVSLRMAAKWQDMLSNIDPATCELPEMVPDAESEGATID